MFSNRRIKYSSSSYSPSYSSRERRSLSKGCTYQLILVYIILSVLVYIALALHPEGFPLFSWIIAHL